MSSFSEFSSLFCYSDHDADSVWHTDSDYDEESSTPIVPIPEQAVRLALPPAKRRGKFVSIHGGLLFVQHYNTKVDSKEFQGILRFDLGANKWTEWIPYPKGVRIFALSVVLDEERQMLYIFQSTSISVESEYDEYDRKWLTMVDLTKKTFTTKSTQIDYPTLVKVGDVIYIYHSERCLKWNVETKQTKQVLHPDFCGRWLPGGLYFSM